MYLETTQLVVNKRQADEVK